MKTGGTIRRRSLVGVALTLIVAPFVAIAPDAGATTLHGPNTGFPQPFAGTPQYQYVAPNQITDDRRLHQPLGQQAADRIARQIGLDPTKVFTAQQYHDFITGGGVGGDKKSAALVDASVKILTNTVGHPLIRNINGQLVPTVLASYGLFVNANGMLMSPANDIAPTRKVNAVIAPGGYLGQWCKDNGAEQSLAALYASAYTSEVVFGNFAQQQSEKAELAPNNQGRSSAWVGMSMGPALWVVNFALIYTLNPSLAALMPAQWAPIPENVAYAILKSRNGRVPYADYAKFLQ
jgi:hypothetical protein